MNLSTPKSNKAEILHTLIKDGCVSLKDFPWLASFRTRVSELCIFHNLPLRREYKTEVNKFNNPFTYVLHHLDEPNYEKAISLYNEINS